MAGNQKECTGKARESAKRADVTSMIRFKALSQDAIFLATYNAILLLGDVKSANTSFHQSLLIYF